MITTCLARALRFHGRWRVYDADATMARVAAGRRVERLGADGFLVMRRTAGVAPMRRARAQQ
jgi:hypothetical protein